MAVTEASNYHQASRLQSNGPLPGRQHRKGHVLVSTIPTISARVVATLDGSLPEGGYEADTPIYAADVPGLMQPGGGDSARSVALRLSDKIAFYIDDVISREEAAYWIDLTEGLGYRAAAPGIQTPPGMRRNKTVHWIAPAEAMEELFRRIAPLLPQEIEGRPLTPRLSQRVNMYRYDEGDEFNLHVDGDWPGFGLTEDGTRLAQWIGTHSMLTMLLYLNGAEDGIEGGETILYDQGEPRIAVAPKTGRALFFRHGSNRGSVLHAGDTITGPVSKYVARINVMYETLSR